MIEIISGHWYGPDADFELYLCRRWFWFRILKISNEKRIPKYFNRIRDSIWKKLESLTIINVANHIRREILESDWWYMTGLRQFECLWDALNSIIDHQSRLSTKLILRKCQCWACGVNAILSYIYSNFSDVWLIVKQVWRRRRSLMISKKINDVVGI